MLGVIPIDPKTTQERKARVALLKEALSERILVIDGAMGTAIQAEDLKAKDFGGEQYEGCNEYLVVTRPDVIEKIHRSYLSVGCDIIETDTFGGTPLVMGEFSLSNEAESINIKAASIARRVCDEFTDKPRFVAGSIGPTTKAISVTGGITFNELVDHFYIQARGLFLGGVDYFLIETCQDTRNVKAALLGIDRLFVEAGCEIPVAVSGTIEPMGTMLGGQSVEALVASLWNRELLYLGLNCATGPEFMTDPIRSLSQLSPFPVACVPNAGLPDERGCYLESPRMMCDVLTRFLDSGWVNVIGGCCGTESPHIKAFVELVRGKKAHRVCSRERSVLSGIEFLEVTRDLAPVVVGERTNVIGSSKFKKLICEEKFEEAAEIARRQVKNGAQIIDICLANPDRDELTDITRFLEKVTKMVKVPLMIDSTDAKVIETALTYCQGKAIINSVNLEDGEERFEHVVPLARKFGAALVVGTIDEDPVQGMGVSRKRKLEIARREYELLTNKYQVLPEDIYWDPLVFPCGTGDAQYVGSALETVEGLRLIKQEFPRTKAVLGISNVSFGLPTAGREVLNSVFLYHCVQAGLDLAIVNSEKLERYASLSDEDKKLSEGLLFTKEPQALQKFTEYFRGKKAAPKMNRESVPLMDRLPRYVVEGTKEGLIEDLDEALKTLKPLEVINGPLMKGMDEVGKLFNANKLIVAEVLQSAEVMKAAVSHLEPKMEKSDSAERGKVLLATVKGDVHDIGKNLVEIILSNNGFKVINLGIKVPPEELIRAVSQHSPDIIGLSGLLVKSAQQMVVTAEDFARAGISTPILVGGAALTSNFVDRQIARVYATGTVAYAPDAMAGLDLAKRIVDVDQFKALQEELLGKRKAPVEETVPKVVAIQSTERSSGLRELKEVPAAPDWDRHTWSGNPKIEQLWGFINPMMLLGRHLGIKGGVVKDLEKFKGDRRRMSDLRTREPKSVEIVDCVEEVKEQYRDAFTTKAVWQYFRASSKGNDLKVFDTGGKCVEVFHFPRSGKLPHLCLADYVRTSELPVDSVGLFVVTVGTGIRQLAEELKVKGQYLKSHVVQALALESAEAFAEFMHSQMRRMWGFGDPPAMTMLERFQAKYRGKRYSFGYPACPNLSDQQKLFSLLKPEEIGVELTEGDMMEPEASVSALVFHHPQCSYFSVGGTDE